MKSLKNSLITYIKQPPHLMTVKLFGLVAIFVSLIYVSVDSTAIVKLKNLASVISSSCISSLDHTTYVNQRDAKIKEKVDAEAKILTLQNKVSSVDTKSINDLQSDIDKVKTEMDSSYTTYNSYLKAVNSDKANADAAISQANVYLTAANTNLSLRDGLKKPQNRKQAYVYKQKYDAYNAAYQNYYSNYSLYVGYYNTYNASYNLNYNEYQTYLERYNTAKASYDSLNSSLAALKKPVISEADTAEINSLTAKVTTLTTEISTLNQYIAKDICKTTTTTTTTTTKSGYTADGRYIRENITPLNKRSGESCLGTSDCNSDLVCIGGVCVGGSYCTSNDDCISNNTSSGDICLTSRQRCVPSTIGACNSSSDCSSGSCYDSVCAEEDPRHPSCSSSAQCSGNQQCISGSCQDTDDGSCTSNRDCNAGDSCVAGKCEDNSNNMNSRDTNGDGRINCCVCVIGAGSDNLDEEIDYCKNQYQGFSCDEPTFEIVEDTRRYPSYQGGSEFYAFYTCADGEIFDPANVDPNSTGSNDLIRKKLIDNNVFVHLFYNEHEDATACESGDVMQMAAYGLSGSVNMCGCNSADDLDRMRVLAWEHSNLMDEENLNGEIVWTGNQNIAVPGQELFGEVCAGKYSFHINRKGVTESAGTCPTEGALCPTDADYDDTIKCEDDKKKMVDYTCVTTGTEGTTWGRWKKGNL